MNKYRVDINHVKRVPCGMNSIRYIGDSMTIAKRHLISLQLNGGEHLGEPITRGCLSKWDHSKRDFVIIDFFDKED